MPANGAKWYSFAPPHWPDIQGLLKKSMRTRSSWTVVVGGSEGGGHFQ